MNIITRFENIIIALIAIALTVVFLELTRIQPLKKEMAIQKIDYNKRIDKQDAVIIDLAKIEKYKIENKFDKMKPKNGQIVLSLDNKLSTLQLDSIKQLATDPQTAIKENNGFWNKLKFW